MTTELINQHLDRIAELEREKAELQLKLDTAEQNAAHQREMKAKAREQRDKVTKERAELVARQVGFYNVLMKSENIDVRTKELISGIWISMPDVNQCLNQIKSEAGRAGFIAGYCEAQSAHFTANDTEIDLYADEYAAFLTTP